MEYLRWEGLGPGFGQVVWLDLDLSSPKRAKAAAEEVIRRERRLDILGGLCLGYGISIVTYIYIHSQQCRSVCHAFHNFSCFLLNLFQVFREISRR